MSCVFSEQSWQATHLPRMQCVMTYFRCNYIVIIGNCKHPSGWIFLERLDLSFTIFVTNMDMPTLYPHGNLTSAFNDNAYRRWRGFINYLFLIKYKMCDSMCYAIVFRNNEILRKCESYWTRCSCKRIHSRGFHFFLICMQMTSCHVSILSVSSLMWLFLCRQIDRPIEWESMKRGKQASNRRTFECLLTPRNFHRLSH